MGSDPADPAAACPPGPRRPALRGTPAPGHRAANLLAGQHQQPGPLSGLAFGNPADVAFFFNLWFWIVHILTCMGKPTSSSFHYSLYEMRNCLFKEFGKT